ncbi:MAG: hypothetical protein M3N98_15385 [Actinomycetota bacterium]|nr:hypothetical protein [Actinomycetota bacterium]
MGLVEPPSLPDDRRLRYTVFVDDNFHYMDPDERYRQGDYDDYELAVTVCKQIVERSLLHQFVSGMKAEELWSRYKSFGEDPFVRPPPPAPMEPFSAWTYARHRCQEICR